MNKQELQNRQKPLKQKYTEDAEAAVVTLHAEGKLGEGISCKVDTGKALFDAGVLTYHILKQLQSGKKWMISEFTYSCF